jgi:hypothetical protein
MMPALAILLFGVLSAIAVLHAHWGLGGTWPAASPQQLARSAVGTPGISRMPPPASCFTVAAILGAVAVWPLFVAGLLPEPWPRWFTLVAGTGIATVLLARGIAGYVPAWRRRFSEPPFARLDRLLYAPLCLALGAGFVTILIAGG